MTDPLVDLGDNNQIGDVGVGNIAGNSIYHGLSPDATVQMLARYVDKESTYRQLDAAAREIRQRETDASMDRVYGELRMIRWIAGVAAVLAIVILAAAVF